MMFGTIATIIIGSIIIGFGLGRPDPFAKKITCGFGGIIIASGTLQLIHII